MSSLTRRVSLLEQQLGPCPACRGATLELRYAAAPAASTAITERCESCEEPLQRISVLLAFDPSPAGNA